MLSSMRRVPALVAAVSLAATGCSFSSVDPDQAVHISGRALDASGKPLADARVMLFKQADMGEVLFGTTLLIGSLSTICLVPDAPAICEKAHRATTDADGRYRFTLKGEDTQGTLGTESTLNVVFSAGRASTTVSFRAKDTEVAVPEARLVDLDARVTRPGGAIRVTWRSLPRSAGRKPSYTAQLFDAGNRGAVWSEPAKGGRATLDPRILENRSGAVAVGADTELAGGSNTGTVHAAYLSSRLPVAATAGAPPSRGRRCAPVTGTAPAVDGTFARCAATDGNLDEPARLSGTGDTPVTGVTVDLGRARPIDLVVARGFSGQLLLEVSGDGRSYRTVATGLGTAVALEPRGNPTARYVRLRSPSGLDESLATELSVW